MIDQTDPVADPRARCLSLLRARCAAVPDLLRGLLAAPPPVDALPGLAARSYLVTGIGVSEGPARYLAALLRRCALLRAEFVPLSAFAHDDPPRPWDTLVVFSQGLCPNARLALRHRRRFRDTVLVTAAAALPGTLTLRHPPEAEDGPLLRVLGPVGALCVAALFAEAVARAAGVPWQGALSALPEAVQRIAAAPGLPDEPLGERIALVGGGGYGDLCHGLCWKLLEGLWVPQPPVWDVLQIAHGPFQQFFPRPCTLLSLCRDDAPGDEELLQRLGRILIPGRHRLVPLRATLPGHLAVFEHDAWCNVLLLAELTRAPRDLADWPGKGLDAPLYDLGRDA